ncbi:MAG: hypothetical protein ABFD83_08425 [Armatimonadota bacterium]
MKRKVVIALVLIAAVAVIYGAVSLLSPKPQYVLVPTDSRPGPDGQAGSPGNCPAPGNMAAQGPQPGDVPTAEKPDVEDKSELSKKPSATVSVEEDNTSASTKRSDMKNLPMGPVKNDGRTIPAGMRSSFDLVRVVMDIGRLEESKKDSVTASQAKAILAIVNPLRSRKTLDAAQAKAAASKLNAILTSAQKKAISERPRREMNRPEGQNGGQHPGSPPPSEASRPGGPPQNMGSRPGMDMNPLSSSSKSPMADMIKKTIKALEAKIKK